MKIQDGPRVATRVDTFETGDGLVTARQNGVVAVVVQHGDRMCSLFFRGSGTGWPSTDRAKDAVEKIAPGAVWRETTLGVWVARTATSEPPVLDHTYGHSRREPDKPRRTSTRGDSYMAARVLRGIIPGRS